MPTAKIRNDSPTSKVRNDSPTAKIRMSSFISNNVNIKAGTPIGLLLALTYANDITNLYSSEGPQYVRIRNID